MNHLVPSTWNGKLNMNGETQSIDKYDAIKTAFAIRLRDAQQFNTFILKIFKHYRNYKNYKSSQLHFYSFLQHDISNFMRSVVSDISVKKHIWRAYHLHLLENKAKNDCTIVCLHELLMDVKTGLCMAFLALENGSYWPLGCQLLRWKDQSLIVENEAICAIESKRLYSYFPKNLRRKFKLDRNKNIQV